MSFDFAAFNLRDLQNSKAIVSMMHEVPIDGIITAIEAEIKKRGIPPDRVYTAEARKVCPSCGSFMRYYQIGGQSSWECNTKTGCGHGEFIGAI